MEKKTLVRYYSNKAPCGWHVAYLDSIAEPRKGPKIAVLIPAIPGKNRVRVLLTDIEVVPLPA